MSVRPAHQERAALSIDGAARAVIALLALVIVALIWLHDRPPIVDWPNHMARHHLEALWLSGKPLPEFYEIQYGLMPNLASDLIVPPLLLVFGTVTASKIFLIFAVFLYWAGPAAFVLQYGNRSAPSWAVCALVMPWVLAGTFFWGFMNYYSGVGLAFLVAANHIRMARRERVPLWQYFAHAALLVLCYLWHLTAIGIYLVLAGCFMLDSAFKSGLRNWWPSVRREFPFILTMLPALGVMIAVMLQPKLNALAGGTVWSTPLRKITLAFGYFGAYDLKVDIPLMAAWAVALLLLFRLRWPATLRLDYVGLAMLAFGLLYLALPVEVGTTSGADIRMLPPLFFTATALLARLDLARTAYAALALIMSLGLARYGIVHMTWRGMESDSAALHAHFTKAPPQSKVLVLTLDRASKTNFQSHLIGWAVPANNAYVSSLFSYAGQQPLTLKRQPAEGTVSFADGGPVFDKAAVKRDFDYVWVFDPSGSGMVLPAGWTFVLGQGAGKLYKLH